MNSRRRDAIFARRAKYMGEKAGEGRGKGRGGWRGGGERKKEGVASRWNRAKATRTTVLTNPTRATRETYMPSPATKIKTRPATYSHRRALALCNFQRIRGGHLAVHSAVHVPRETRFHAPLECVTMRYRTASGVRVGSLSIIIP